MPSDRPMGIETEFAIGGRRKNGMPLDRDSLLRRLSEAAMERWRFLPSSNGNGIFTESGARFYFDTGGHPEFCVGESSDLNELVSHVKAGERLLSELVDLMEEQDGGESEIWIFRSNVDYSVGEPRTWGQHSSFLIRNKPETFLTDLIPHLVTRAYSWAGGLNPFMPNGLQFCLFPRALFFVRPIGPDSTAGRGIFHTRDESLAGPGYWRLHILCGESLHSEVGLWLQLGTTALIVAMTEAGLKPGRGIELKNPVQALHLVASNLCHPLVLIDGRKLTALDIQEHFLEQAERYQDRECMPHFAPEVCRRWREILTALRKDPRTLSKVLDWPFKAELFEKICREHGFSMNSFAPGNDFRNRLYEALKGTAYERQSPDVGFLIGPRSPILEVAARMTPELRKAGLSWSTLAAPKELRQKLLEGDLRLSQLGPRGLFQQLDQAGMLERRIVREQEIELAKTNPPARGRAAIRGKVVRELCGDGGTTCDWQFIRDKTNGRLLDLSDPFCSTERWIWEDDSDEDERDLDASLNSLLEDLNHVGNI